MERQDRWGTGRAVAGPDPATMTTPWIFRRLNTTSPVSHGPSLGADGLGFFGTWVNNLCAKMEMASGNILGSFVSAGFVQCTPAISALGDAVYISTGGKLLRINSSSMDWDWFVQTNNTGVNDFESSSAVVGPDGDVVFGATTGTAWRVDEVSGVPVWTMPALHDIRHTAAFNRDDTLVFFANGNRMSAVNYATGVIAWTLDTGSRAGAPAVAPDGAVVFGNQAGTVYALEPLTGAVRWTKATLAAITGAPAFSNDGVAYVPSHDWRLYAYRMSDGFRFWSFTGSHENWTAPTVGYDGSIYIYNRVGSLYRIASNGSLIWYRQCNGESRGGPISIDADGTLYVGLNANGIGLAIIKQQATALAFESLNMEIGTLTSGGVGQLVESDDQYANLKSAGQADLSRTDPQIRARIELNSPYPRLSQFTLKFEGQCSLGNTAEQRIEMFNFSGGNYETLDLRPATTGDSAFEMTVVTDASRFVQNGSGLIKLRASWHVPNGPRFWTARIDRATFVNVIPDWTP